MTEPHRATPEQWAIVASEAADGSATHSCMLELNDTLRALCRARNDLVVCNTEQNQRIEALEAAQLEQAGSHRFCTDAIVRRVEALELAHRIQSGTLTSAERAELGVVPVANLEAAAHRAAAEARDAAMAILSHLSDAEREQVAQELAKPAACRPLEVETTYGSGDAQRIAQELLKPRAMVVRGSFEHGGKQFSYEAEAMEAERPPHQDKLDRLIALDAADPTPDAAMTSAEAGRDPECVAKWPDCYEDGYDPRCCRFPKSCRCSVYQPLPSPVIALDREDPTPDPTTPEPRAASAEAQPAGGLVERVANAISEGDEPDKWHPEARDAIREVAKWLRSVGNNGSADELEQQANQ